MQNAIVKSVELKAPVAKVWQAIADHREFGDWFGVKIDSPFVAGQPASGQITHPGYEHLKWEVEIRAIESERLLSFTWHPYAVDMAVDYSTETPTLVEFKLESSNGGTLLTVTESGFEDVPEGRRAEAFRMNEGGWEQQMKNIEKHLEQRKKNS